MRLKKIKATQREKKRLQRENPTFLSIPCMKIFLNFSIFRMSLPVVAKNDVSVSEVLN